MSDTSKPSLNVKKQGKLPAIRQSEALASLGMLWAHVYIAAFLTPEEKHVHTTNVVEFLVGEGAMTRERGEELIPF